MEKGSSAGEEREAGALAARAGRRGKRRHDGARRLARGTAGVREPGTTATAEKRRWRHEEETASALSAGLCPAELRPASVVEEGGGDQGDGKRRPCPWSATW